MTLQPSNVAVGLGLSTVALVLLIITRRVGERRETPFWDVPARLLPRWAQALALVLLLATGYGIFVRTAKQVREAQIVHDVTRQSSDIIHYHQAAQKVAEGAMPWRDFEFEYPPTAAYLISPPAIGHADLDRKAYTERYILYIGGFLALATTLIGILWMIRVPIAKAILGLGAWTFALSNMGELTFLRMEPIIAVATVLGFTALYWGGESRSSRFVAGVMFGIAAAKIYPLILIVPICAWLFRQGRLWPYLAGLTVGLLPLLLPALLGSSGVESFLGYHTKRHFEIGSLYSVLFQRVPEGRIGEAFGSVEWRFRAENTVSKIATVLTLAATLVPIAYSFRRGATANTAYWCGAAALAGFIVFNKVGSPQYATWLLTVALCAVLLPMGTRAWLATLVATGVCCYAAVEQILHFTFDNGPAPVFVYLTFKVIVEAVCFGVFWTILRQEARRASGTAVADVPEPI